MGFTPGSSSGDSAGQLSDAVQLVDPTGPQTLFTKIGDVKKLDLRFVLGKAFTVNTQRAIAWLEALYPLLSEQGLLDGQYFTIPFADGERKVVTVRGDRKQGELQSERLYLSDAVAILAALAKRLHDLPDVDASLKSSLSGFGDTLADSPNVLEWIQGYDKLDKTAFENGFFAENALAAKYHEIQKLIELLLEVFGAYLGANERPPAGYITQEKLTQYLRDAIFADAIFEYLQKSDKFRTLLSVTDALQQNSQVSIQESAETLQRRVTNNQELVRGVINKLLSESNSTIDALIEEFYEEFSPTLYPQLLVDPPRLIWELLDENQKFTLYYKDDDKENQLFSSQAFENALKQFTQHFGENFEKDLEENLLRPAQTVVAAPAVTIDDSADSGDTGLPNEEVFDIYRKNNVLSREQLQYEAAWISSDALLQLFGIHGLNEAGVYGIDPQLYGDIRSEVYALLSTYSVDQINKLFASDSNRMRAVALLIKRLQSNPAISLRIDQVYTHFKLGISISDATAKRSSTAVQAQIAKLLQDEALATSPALNINLQNTVDSLIFNYGLNELLPEEQRVNRKDAVWFVEHLDDKMLLAIFFAGESLAAFQRLPSGEQRAIIEKLKNILSGFIVSRAREMALRAQTADVGKGLLNEGNGVGDEDANAIGAGNITHFTTGHAFSSVREDLGADGKGMDRAIQLHMGADSGFIQRLNDAARLFKPAWDALDIEDQKRIYAFLNLALPPASLGKLPFTIEFMFLTAAQINALRRAQDMSNAASLREESEYATTYYEATEFAQLVPSAVSESIGMMQALDEDEGVAPEEAGASGGEAPGAGTAGPGPAGGVGDSPIPGVRGVKHGPRKESLFNRLREKLKKTKSKKASKVVSNTLAKSFKKFAAEAAKQLTQWIGNIVPGLGTALAAAGGILQFLWKHREKVLGALAGMAIAFIRSLFSLPGLLGFGVGFGAGAAFGPIGAAVGGPMGAMLGSSAFQTATTTGATTTGLSQQGAATTGLGQSATSATGSAAAATTTAETSVLANLAANILSPAAIGVIAPGALIMMSLFSTLYIIFTIQGSFLVRTPSLVGFYTNFPPGGPPLEGCFAQGIAGFSFPDNVRPDRVISTAWTEGDWNTFTGAWNAEASTNACFVKRVCGTGTPVTIFRLPGSAYGGWAPSGLNGTALGLYDLAFLGGGSSEYTVIHELGHIIDYRNPGLRADFIAKTGLGASSGNCLNYEFGCADAEAFAQAVVLGLIWDKYKFGGTTSYNFPQIAPKAYEWVVQNIYSCQ